MQAKYLLQLGFMGSLAALSAHEDASMSTIFWYDFETTGTNPRSDRALQVAGLRTDENLQPIGQPLNIYCRLSDDILPHPMASLITGISVEDMQSGLHEADFFARLHQELSQPGTCIAGFNSVRFDDELTRYGLYRNFYDPYAHEWQNSNSRWDILDALRCAWALRPEGINWPKNAEGRHSFRLELLTAANGIEHGQAHDALADVQATIAMARLLKDKQPQLYEYLFQLRRKQEVQSRLQIGVPCVHISGRFVVERNCLGIVLPLCQHPTNPNAVICADLQSDPSTLLTTSAEQLAQQFFTSNAALAAQGLTPAPLKVIQVNRCPVIAPISVLRPQDIERLQINTQQWQLHQQQLLAQLPDVVNTINQAFTSHKYPEQTTDPEQMLYAGFINSRDRNLCQQVQQSSPEQLANRKWQFDDQRLPELLFRYQARNFTDSLNDAQQQQWHSFCQQRLHESSAGAPLTIDGFYQELQQLTQEQQNSKLMLGWLQYVQQLQARYSA